MINSVFILGTKDPEMEEIEKIIKQLNYNFIYNQKNIPKYNKYIKIETYHPEIKDYVLLDHHNKHDNGFHLGHEDFLEASSIGQFLKYILEEDFENVINILKFDNEITKEKNGFVFNKKWFFITNGHKITIPKKIVYIAGIDHCPKEAYQGLCKGIKKENLLNKRLIHIAKNTKTNLTKIKERYYYLKKKYFTKTENLKDLTNINLGEGNYPIDYLLIREIALKENQPIVIRLKNKLMFLSLEEEYVKDILSIKEYKKFKIKETFGVPKRSYAGAIY